MPHKVHSGQHRSNRSNPTSQGHFQSFDWYLHKMVSRSDLFWSACLCKIWILKGKSLRSSWRILKTDVLKMPVSFERQSVDFLGKSSWRFRKLWIFSGIMPNDKRSWPLWASATLPVFWNLATKRWIVLQLGTLFLPKSFLHWRCVR